MFDSMIIGQITLDHNIDYDGREEFINGGAVTFSGYAAAAIGHSVAVVPKGNTKVIDPYKVFRDSRVEKIFPVESETYTEMQNTHVFQRPLAVTVIALVQEIIERVGIHIGAAQLLDAPARFRDKGTVVLIDHAERAAEVQKDRFDALLHAHTLRTLSHATCGAFGKISLSSLKSAVMRLMLFSVPVPRSTG